MKKAPTIRSRLSRISNGFKRSTKLLGWWQNDGVDYVNHAILAFDVGLDDLGLVDQNSTVNYADSDFRSLNGFDFLAVQFHDVGRHGFGWDHVVGQNCNQFGFIFRLQ